MHQPWVGSPGKNPNPDIFSGAREKQGKVGSGSGAVEIKVGTSRGDLRNRVKSGLSRLLQHIFEKSEKIGENQVKFIIEKLSFI